MQKCTVCLFDGDRVVAIPRMKAQKKGTQSGSLFFFYYEANRGSKIHSSRLTCKFEGASMVCSIGVASI